MPNLVAYNSGSPISNAIQFGTIVMDVNNDVPRGSLLWCPDFGICNQYIIITDSYTNGKTNQSNSRAMGFKTPTLTSDDLIEAINKLAASKFAGPFITLEEAINWAIYQGYFITNQEYPSIVTNGCVLNLDSNFPPSYPLVFDAWYDLTGNGNTGLLNNGVFYDDPLRGSLLFNGTNQYVSFSATTGIPVGNSQYTISVWFNPASLGDKGLVGWGNYGTTNAVNAFRLSSSGISNYWWGNDLSASYSFTTGNWYNAVATFDGLTRSIWINGTFITSDTPVGHNVPNSNNLTVGTTNTTEFFDGNIGEVQIFNRALSSVEIYDNFNALLPRYNGSYTDPCDIAPYCTPTPTGTPSLTQTPTSTVSLTQTPTSSIPVTPSTTPTTLPPIFTLNRTPNLPNGSSACYDYSIYNRASYYASTSNGSTIHSGTFLYTNFNEVGNPSYYIPDGYYSDGTTYWFFQNGSTGDAGTPCPVVSPTPTVTATPTPSYGSSPTPTASITATPTQTPTNTATQTKTPTQTPTIGSSPRPTETPTTTPTQTTTPTVTPTQTYTPTITPMPTNTPFPNIPNYRGQSTVSYPVCLISDPGFVTIYERNYDGYSNVLNWLNVANPSVNNPYDTSGFYVKSIYNTLGQDLTIRDASGNAVLDLSYYNLVAGNTYYVKYDTYCDTCGCSPSAALIDAVSGFQLYNLNVGNATSSPVNYSTNTSGQDVCYPFNQTLFIYYDIAQTNVSLGAPLAVGSTIYTDNVRSTTAPAGAYVMANNNKYIVNSSGVVTSIETNACTSKPTFFGKIKPTNFTVKVGITQLGLTVGDSYQFYWPYCSPSTLRGTISSITGTGGDTTITLINWNAYCD